jgi:hypothetical protein
MPAHLPDLAPPSRRRLRGALAAAAVALGAALLLPHVAAASQGYTGYAGSFDSSDPNGYSPAPQLTAPRATVEYDFAVANQNPFGATLSGTVYVARVVSYQSNPGDASASVFDPAVTVDETTLLEAAKITLETPAAHPLDPDDQQFGSSLMSQPVEYTEKVPVGPCGYFAIWVGDSDAATVSTFNPSDMPTSQSSSFLNAGVVRVTDGCVRPTPKPTPRPARHRATATPSPTASPTPEPSPTASPTPHHRRSNAADPLGGLGTQDDTPPPPDASAYASANQDQGIGGGPAVVAAAVLAAGLTVATTVFVRERRLGLDLARLRRRPRQ